MSTSCLSITGINLVHYLIDVHKVSVQPIHQPSNPCVQLESLQRLLLAISLRDHQQAAIPVVSVRFICAHSTNRRRDSCENFGMEGRWIVSMPSASYRNEPILMGHLDVPIKLPCPPCSRRCSNFIRFLNFSNSIKAACCSFRSQLHPHKQRQLTRNQFLAKSPPSCNSSKGEICAQKPDLLSFSIFYEAGAVFGRLRSKASCKKARSGLQIRRPYLFVGQIGDEKRRGLIESSESLSESQENSTRPRRARAATRVVHEEDNKRYRRRRPGTRQRTKLRKWIVLLTPSRTTPGRQRSEGRGRAGSLDEVRSDRSGVPGTERDRRRGGERGKQESRREGGGWIVRKGGRWT
eukprot:758048-Hanusia_phi.AAC.2